MIHAVHISAALTLLRTEARWLRDHQMLESASGMEACAKLLEEAAAHEAAGSPPTQTMEAP